MIPILTKQQLKAFDEYTIENEPVSSIDLMFRAATIALHAIVKRFPHHDNFVVLCGTGNNGGDGLVIAHGLMQMNKSIRVFAINESANRSSDFNHYLNLYNDEFGVRFSWVNSEREMPELDSNAIVIDAVFGYGLTRPIEGVYAEIIEAVNRLPNCKIAIDLPSGLMCDESTVIKKNSVLKANFTFTFQVYKKCLLVSENQDFIGEVELLDIGLKIDFLNSIKITSFVIDERFVRASLPVRNTNVSKFDFGHALLLAGSLGKMGAAVISSKACLRTGTGLLSVQIPECGIEIMQTSVPEAMVIRDEGKEYLSTVYIKGKYDAVGIGPGIARKEETARVLKSLLQNANVPMVVDADGLNILSDNKTWLAFANSPLILTPHAGEFERLFGKADSDFDRLQLACENAMKYNCYIVLKGKNTVVISPDRNMYFNVNGNAGLAKGGSGDALTGIILALLAQDYSPLVASIGGVFLHGRAADITLEKQSKESMLITDVIDNIGKAFDSIHQ